MNNFDDKIEVNQGGDKAQLTEEEIIDLERDLPDCETIFTEEMLMVDEKDAKMSKLDVGSFGNLEDLVTCETKIEETKTRLNNFIGNDEKAKTLYNTIKEQIWHTDNIDAVVEKNLGLPTQHHSEGHSIQEVTTLVLCEKILDESNKRQITKVHIANKEGDKF